MLKMPDGWKDRVKIENGQSWFSDEDAAFVHLKMISEMKDEARAYPELYRDCGELNCTKLVEEVANENDLNVCDGVVDVWYAPEQLFEWAHEISGQIEKEWEQKDNQDEEEEDD